MGFADRRQSVRCSSLDLHRRRDWEPPSSLSGQRWNPKPRSKLNRPAARENRRYAPTKEGRGQGGTAKPAPDGLRTSVGAWRNVFRVPCATQAGPYYGNNSERGAEL